jgi:hypothetical protein
MKRAARWLGAGAGLAGLIASLVVSSEAHGQAPDCIQGGDHVPITFGSPDAQGITREDRLAGPAEKHGYYFTVPPQGGSAFIYVGDQWYDLDLFLFSRGRCGAGSWEVLARAWSVRAERRTLQFVRPDEQIIELAAGEHLLIVGHKYAEDPQFAADFNPERGFTIRVALNPAVCNLDPPNVPAPNPFDPSLSMMKRPDDALYQLALIIEPQSPGLFSLMSFNAVVSPPYTDLFDFEWSLDGQPVPGVNIPTTQSPTQALPKGAAGEHSVRVVARGVREYPDPDQPHIPLNGGTLSVQCTFRVGAS